MDSEPGQSTTKATGSCRFCGAQSSLRCSRCKDVFYCGREHSVGDWKRHKRFCVAAEGVEPRPIMIDAILLPVDATQPRMIKLACAVQRDEDAELPEFDIVHRWDKNVYFDREPSALRTFIPGGGGFAALLGTGYQLDFFYDDCAFLNGSPLNQCVQALTRGAAPHPWSGNLVGVRCERPLTYCMRYYNANMKEDLPRLLDVFMRYGTDSYNRYDPGGATKWIGRMDEYDY